jgi:hypothetical protein
MREITEKIAKLSHFDPHFFGILGEEGKAIALR